MLNYHFIIYVIYNLLYIAELKMAERNVWAQPKENGKYVIHR